MSDPFNVEDQAVEPEAPYSLQSHWPDVPRIAFGPTNDPYNANLQWVQSRGDMHAYVEGYRRLAETAFEGAMGQRMSPEYLLFPLAYLWRHYLELALKEAIAMGRVLDGGEWSYPTGHRLELLWAEARPYIAACGADDAPELANVEANILEFVRIDPGAVGFRYPLNVQGTAASLTNAPAQVNVVQLHSTMMALGNFFLCVRSEQTHRIDYQQEHAGDGYY